MKKKFLVVSMFAALMLATSCSKDDSENNVVPQPVNTEVVNNGTQPVVEKTYPITVKASKKTSVSKISLGDNGTDECFEIGDKLVLTWGADGLVELELNDGAGLTSATFLGEIPESANGQTITAHIGTPITSTSTLGYTSLADAVHNCCYLVSNKSFTYTAGENIEPLTLDDQNSYLHFQLAESQTKFDLNIDGNTFTFSDFSNHEIWIAVPGGKTIKGNMISTGGKELESAKVYTVDRTDVVDLGTSFSVLWCTTNLGASNPGDYGKYYAYGETTGYAYGDGHDFSLVSYTGGDNPLPAEKDAATAALGTGFRMPTSAETTTLCNCAKTWESQNGNNGCKFSTDYGSVFLPTAGFCGGTNRGGESTRGCFWTSTPDNAKPTYARNLGFSYNDKVYVGSDARSYGLSVRAVLYMN